VSDESAAEATTLPLQTFQKPALLKGGMVVCWIYAAVLALFLAILPAAGAVGADFLNGSRIFIIPLLVLSIVVAYGLAKDRHWSRWVMMLLLVLGIVLIPPPLANPIDYGFSIAFAIFGWWYLYRKPNVVAYYDAVTSGGR